MTAEAALGHVVVGAMLTTVAALAGYRFATRYSLRKPVRGARMWRAYLPVMVLPILAMQVLPHDLYAGWVWILPFPAVFGALWLGSRRRHLTSSPS